MTVRITKPEFNLREKITELDRPVGLHGNEILRSETPQSTFDLVGTGRKNMVINGGMVISQRYGTSEHTPSHTQHVLDRMSFDVHVSSKLKAQQVTDAPTGFSHSMKVTSLSAHSTVSNNYFLMQYFVEGNDSARLKWGTSEAQPVTLSFYVKSSLAGTHACGIRNSDYNRSITKTYTIDQTDTWEYKTVTFPGDRTGTWLTDENAGLKINFDLGSGSDFEAASTGTWLATHDFTTSDTVKFVGTNGATWYITGIQLETGSLATPFEHRHLTEELLLCQRYYQVHDGHYFQVVSPSTGATADFYITLPYWVPMNHGPDVTQSYTLSGATTNNLVTVTATKAKFSLRPTTANSEVYVLADTLRLDAEIS